jgi:Fe-S cluster assembly protein SufD
MVTAKPRLDHCTEYLAAFQMIHEVARSCPTWLRQLRNKAFDEFTAVGLPTNRRGNEEWKYTDVRRISRAPFLPSRKVTGYTDQETPAVANDQRFSACLLNGKFSRNETQLGKLPNGVIVGSLMEAVKAQEDLVRTHIARHANWEGEPFTAFNTAFFEDGIFVYVPDGISVPGVVSLQLLSQSAEMESSHPRVLVILGVGAKLTLLEDYRGVGAEERLVNGVVEFVLMARSQLDTYRVQRQTENVFHIVTTSVDLEAGASFSSLTMDVGGALARNKLSIKLQGEFAESDLRGLYVGSGAQHMDNQVVVDHVSPKTISRQLYKGILDDRAKAVFHGSVIVRKGAYGSEAIQEDRNLLLSPSTEVNAKPALWIYADDVKCRHGAASGQLAEESLFYLRSRGLSEREARHMIIEAFVGEVLLTGENVDSREFFQSLVSNKIKQLPSVKLVEETN